jgi:hypothetical protein
VLSGCLSWTGLSTSTWTTTTTSAMVPTTGDRQQQRGAAPVRRGGLLLEAASRDAMTSDQSGSMAFAQRPRLRLHRASLTTLGTHGSRAFAPLPADSRAALLAARRTIGPSVSSRLTNLPAIVRVENRPWCVVWCGAVRGALRDCGRGRRRPTASVCVCVCVSMCGCVFTVVLHCAAVIHGHGKGASAVVCCCLFTPPSLPPLHSSTTTTTTGCQRQRPNQPCSLDRRVGAGVVLVGPALPPAPT